MQTINDDFVLFCPSWETDPEVSFISSAFINKIISIWFVLIGTKHEVHYYYKGCIGYIVLD